VHVRRGDLSTSTHWSAMGRWVPDQYYESILPQLARLCGAPTTFHVISEGELEWGFVRPRWESLLTAAGVTVAWHLGEEILPTLSHLAESDLLIGARSGFSTTGAAYHLGLSNVPRLFLGDVRIRLPTPPRCSCLQTPHLTALRSREAAARSHQEDPARSHPPRLDWELRRIARGHGDALDTRPLSTAHNCTLFCSTSVPPEGGMIGGTSLDHSLDETRDETSLINKARVTDETSLDRPGEATAVNGDAPVNRANSDTTRSAPDLACEIAALRQWKAQQEAGSWAPIWALLLRAGRSRYSSSCRQ